MERSKMKCDHCQFNIFHAGGSWRSVAEGGDDPYAYYYCSKGHWDGDPLTEEDNEVDYWENCEDYTFQK